MTDIVDEAQRLDEERRADAIRDVVMVARDRHGTPECVDCGEPIEHERRAACPGARRCIDCQHAQEMRRNGHR